MSPEADLSGARRQLIDTCTSPQFRRETAGLLGEGLYPVIEPEVQKARNQKELYVLDESAQIEVPTMLEPRVTETIHASWNKYRRQMADPDHGTTIFAESNERPHTWMKIDTSVRLLRGGGAEIHCVEVDGVHLPLRISLDRGLDGVRNAAVLPKEDKLGDDFFVQLVQAIMPALGEGEDAGMSDKEFREKTIRDRRMREGEETLPLRLLANLPSSTLKDPRASARVVNRVPMASWLEYNLDYGVTKTGPRSLPV